MTLARELPIVPITVTAQGVALVRGTRVPNRHGNHGIPPGRHPRGNRPELHHGARRRCLRGDRLLSSASGSGRCLPRRAAAAARYAAGQRGAAARPTRPARTAAGSVGTTADRAPSMSLLTDENLHRAIVRSLLRRLPRLDVVAVLVLALLAGGCPVPAIVFAFSLDERTVAD